MANNKKTFSALKFSGGNLSVLDQTLLPNKVRYLRLKTYQEVIEAIKQLRIRGAPLIGVAGAYGLALESKRKSSNIRTYLKKVAYEIKTARPTAVNLSWAIERLVKIVSNPEISDSKLSSKLISEAKRIDFEERTHSQMIGKIGAKLIKTNATILTICNTGWLAAPGIGTALGVIYTACQQGKKLKVYVPETRPLLQGARLTAFELTQAKIPYTLITDGMVASVMKNTDIVLVGADRIAHNGDTANKIGTLTLAIIAAYYKVPFYVVAPLSSFDLTKRTGMEIPIEERNKYEIIYIHKQLIAPKTANVYNPAFDITPNKLITGIITEKGLIKPPFIKYIYIQ
jgi:methylthioribose-1-phosphate isomerase